MIPEWLVTKMAPTLGSDAVGTSGTPTSQIQGDSSDLHSSGGEGGI